MLIPFSEIVNRYQIKPTGVLHIGASTGQELEAYLAAGIERSIWVEAIPEVYAQLADKLSKHSLITSQKAFAINACISDVDGKEVDFHITDNEGQSSSMLELAYHKVVHSNVHVERTIKCVTKTMDSIIQNYCFDLAKYDFLNIDLQGAELLALKGMKENLHKIRYAYIEVNEKELYTGCALVKEIDQFLAGYGFHRAETKWTDCGWGDAFYIKAPSPGIQDENKDQPQK